MFSLTTSSSGASRVTLQKLDAWDYRARFRGSQWRWLRDTRFGSAARGITTAPTSQLRPTSRQLLRRVNAFLEWYVRNGWASRNFFSAASAIFPNCHHSLESEKLNNELLHLSFLLTNYRLDLARLFLSQQKFAITLFNFLKPGLRTRHCGGGLPNRFKL